MTSAIIYSEDQQEHSIRYRILSKRKAVSIVVERDRKVIVRAPDLIREERIAKEVAKRKGRGMS